MFIFWAKKIIRDLFSISLFTYLTYFVVELIKPGLISNYFDLNLLLLFIIFLAAAEILLARMFKK